MNWKAWNADLLLKLKGSRKTSKKRTQATLQKQLINIMKIFDDYNEIPEEFDSTARSIFNGVDHRDVYTKHRPIQVTLRVNITIYA